MSNYARNFTAVTLATFLSVASLNAQAGDKKPTGGHEGNTHQPSGGHQPAPAPAPAPVVKVPVEVNQSTVVKPVTNVEVLTPVNVNVKPIVPVTVAPTIPVNVSTPVTIKEAPVTQTVTTPVTVNEAPVNVAPVQTVTEAPVTQTAAQTNRNGATSSGNSTTFTDNSNFRAGSASSFTGPSLNAVKDCVGGVAIGLNGGNVFAGYGGLSFSFSGKEGVLLTNKKGDIVLLDDFIAADPKNRGEFTHDLSGGEKKVLACVVERVVATNKSLATQERMNQDSNLAQENVATINSNAQVEIATIQSATTMAMPGIRHFCFNEVVLDPKTGKAIVETLPIRGTGHENCEQVTWGAVTRVLGTSAIPTPGAKPMYRSHEPIAPLPGTSRTYPATATPAAATPAAPASAPAGPSN